MDGTDLVLVAQTGEQLLIVKSVLTAVQCLWIYDYLLTLGDEIQYGWSGRKSWVFFLFIANRHTPLVHLIWVHFIMFHYEKPVTTKWIPTLHTSAVTVFAHIAIAIRIYAITGKNKLIGVTLAFVVGTELCYGIFAVTWIGLGPLQPLPEINLDAFRFCIYKKWEVGELIFYGVETFFDILAFSIIVITAWRPRMTRYPTVPSILDNILRDATEYFMLIFSAQILSLLFLFVTPENVQLIPAMANTIFVPVMASRLMLSLKKAAIGPEGVWSLDTMTNTTWGRSAEDGTIRFASRVPGGQPRDTLLTSAARSEEDIVELGAVSLPPRNRGSRYAL